MNEKNSASPLDHKPNFKHHCREVDQLRISATSKQQMNTNPGLIMHTLASTFRPKAFDVAAKHQSKWTLDPKQLSRGKEIIALNHHYCGDRESPR